MATPLKAHWVSINGRDKILLSVFLSGLFLMLAGSLLIAVMALFSPRVPQWLGLSLVIIGLTLSQVARGKGFKIHSMMAGLLIIASVPHSWPLALGVTLDGILLSQLSQKRWPYGPWKKRAV